MECYKCASFIEDTVRYPLKPSELLYKDVKYKRLKRIFPEIIWSFQRFFQKITDFQMSVAEFVVDIDMGDVFLKDEDTITRMYWTSMARWCKMCDFGGIHELLEDHYVCSKPEELIGYWISELMEIKDIHREHTKPNTSLVEVL
jgi:hypothetical protein